MSYDSTKDTKAHIKRVADLLKDFSTELTKRGKAHDASKLATPEKELFDELTPILQDLKYGTEEYKESLARLKPALDHHYASNSHHPEHYAHGIDGMNLFDLIEMFCDWKAAGERTAKGDMKASIEYNKNRFSMSHQLYSIFMNTANQMFYDGEN